MKKLAAIILSLALCMGLSVPAFAATMNSDKAAYDVSNQSTGTWDFNYVDYDMDGNEIPVTYTVNLVSAGTVVKATSGNLLSVTTYAEESGSWEGFPGFDNPTSVTIEDNGQVYQIKSVNPNSIDADVIGPVSSLDEGIWLKAGGSAPSAPAAPATPTEPTTPADKPAQPTAPVTPATGSYTVKQGDTYGTIALNNYGTYGVWRELYKANKYVKLAAGVQLTLPAKLGNANRLSAPAAGAGETLYTVKAGDTLGAIAKATYGDVMKYKAIFERNSDRLKNANTIYAGQVIVLPAK